MPAPARLVVVVALLLLAAPCAGRRKLPKIAKIQKPTQHVFEVSSAFSPDECLQIISAADAQPQEDAVVRDMTVQDGKMQDSRVRAGQLTWLVRIPM